jgi:GT2 family glycosyltransferase
MPELELSICIANWNCREELRDCLHSIRDAMRSVAAETIVVDNASTDGAAEMVAGESPWVMLIRNARNEGFARANNQAAAKSRGRFLLFLNNDTRVEPDSLRKLIDFLHAHPEVGAVGPKIVGADGRPQRSCRGRPTLGALLHRLTMFRWMGLFRGSYRRYRRHQYLPDALRQVDILGGAAICLPRGVFFQHGGWDDGFPFGVEDLDLCTRVAKTHALIYYPAARVTHLGRAGTRLNNGFAYTSYACGHARYLRKHLLGPVGMLIYKLLVLIDLPVALGIQLLRRAVARMWPGADVSSRSASELAGLWHFCRIGWRKFLRA